MHNPNIKIKATHMTDHQHQCNGCGRLFKNKDELEAHKLTHNSDGSHRFKLDFLYYKIPISYPPRSL